ncbi:MAG: hypothetical protein WBA12_13645 [Catalinimonas sp.]
MRRFLTFLLVGGALLATACAKEGAEREALDTPMQNAPAPGGDATEDIVEPADTIDRSGEGEFQ